MLLLLHCVMSKNLYVAFVSLCDVVETSMLLLLHCVMSKNLYVALASLCDVEEPVCCYCFIV